MKNMTSAWITFKCVKKKREDGWHKKGFSHFFSFQWHHGDWTGKGVALIESNQWQMYNFSNKYYTAMFISKTKEIK